MMSPHRVGFYALLGVLLLMVASGWAVTTSYWEVNYQDQFAAGTAEKVSIKSDGQVTLSPTLDLLADTGEPFVWCLAEDAAGNIYAGTGNNGKVFKISKDGRSTLLYDSDELEILSLAIGRDGHLYAGTSPGGQIISISPAGDGEVFFSTEENHIWSLVFDNNGDLFCGTGTEGKIFKITSGGRGELYYDTKETNITALAWREGHLYAGGEGNGLIYRIDPQSQAMMLFDAQEQEIRSLVFDPGGILYAAATSGQMPRRRPPRQEKAPPAEIESPDAAAEIMPMFLEESMSPDAGGPSAVYEIDGFGSGTTLWTAPEMAMILCMAPGPGGYLVVGSGDEGRIYSVASDGSWSMLAEGDETQILSLMRTAGGSILVGTGNLGKVFRLGTSYEKKGTLESEVQDASFVARWGRIAWEATRPSGTQLSLQTRSGNSEVPDETWSPWSKSYEDAAGQNVESPPARFIQWRANLSTSRDESTPVLEKVWLAYVQRNQAPKILSLYIQPPANGNGQSASPSQRDGGNSGFGSPGELAPSDPFGGRDQAAQGTRKASWYAFDHNGDRLSYDLFFRGAGEQRWKLLKEDLTVSSYTWDTQSFPDGIYQLRVEATDGPDNPEGQALIAEKDSDPFVVDNTPPRVMNVKGRAEEDGRYLITGQATDVMSPIVELWYSADAQDWKAIPAIDGVFDGLEEGFSFFTKSLSAGEHTIVIKAGDMANNVGAGKVVVK